ncbi:hypothetical protein FRB95_009009 [Tulasnella sp. JGI-2019a]|nr:hypothetical protein FRB95_009009 [Tulasnella sp. JGI-2019a]
MDELIHHCVREISFDGDLGCDVLRLDHFIDDYYRDNGGPSSQQTDRAFKSFIWSLIVREPTTTVGLVPEGSAPVCIAPQPSAMRKKGKADAGASNSTILPSSPAALQPLDPTEVAETTLEDLVVKYGNTLRIAVDHETCFLAITGSHVRPGKLGPMSYTALQFITRTRTDGIPMKALGDATGYDQKTIHYLASQLVDMGHIYKIKTRGASRHSCIHHYFYEKSSFYVSDERIDQLDATLPMEDDEVVPENGAFPTTPKEQSVDTKADIFANAPIERKELENEALVRGRLATLLKASPNNLIRKENLLISLGFFNPTRQDRRFFLSLLKDLSKQGFIDMVEAPHHSDPKKNVTCIRLKERKPATETEVVENPEGDAGLPEEYTNSSNLENRPLAMIAIEHQIIQLISESGTRGMTLNDLNYRLGFLEKRTLDQFVARFERDTPPSHLANTGIVQMVETVKREHRAKYYTLDNYLNIMRKNGLQDVPARYSTVDLSQSGEWATFTAEQFYAPGEEGRKDLKKHLEAAVAVTVTESKPKKGVNGAKSYVNPLGPDGKPKKGRPRKEWNQPPKKRKKPETQPSTPSAKSPGKGKGKRKRSEAELNDDNSLTPLPHDSGRSDDKLPVIKKRSRLSKQKDTGADGSERPPPAHQVHASETVIQGSILGAASSITPSPDQSANLISGLSAGVVGRDTHLNKGPLASFGEPYMQLDPALMTSEVSTLFARRTGMESFTSTNDMTNGMHDLSAEPDASEPPAKRAKFDRNPEQDAFSNPRKFSVNVSYMRREKEVLYILDETNGIAVLNNKDFITRHAALLGEWAAAGLEASAPPGTRLDRRTLMTLIQTMENRGTLKVIKTAIKHKHTTIFYLPTVPEGSVHAFIRDLQSSERMLIKPTKDKVNEQYQDTMKRKLPTQEKEKHRIPASDEQLVTQSPLEVRAALLSDAKTSAQLFGYIVGQIIRARELHLYTLSQITDPDISSLSFTSTTDRVFQTKYFWEDLPVATFCSFVPIINNPPGLEDFLGTPEGARTKVRDLSRPLYEALEVGRNRCRTKVTDILRVLQGLGLAIPLEIARSTSPVVTCHTAGGTTIAFDIFNDPLIPISNIEYWQFKTSAPIYHLADSQEHPPFCGEKPTATVDEGVEYWLTAYQASHDAAFTVDAAEANHPQPQPFLGGSALAKSMRGAQSWSPKYFLGPRQRGYLSRFVDHETGQIPKLLDPDDRNDPFNVLCFAVAASREAVLEYFEGEHAYIMGKFRRQLERKQKRANKEAKLATRRQAAARRLLAQKVRDAKTRMEKDWKDAVAAVHPEPLTEEQLASPSLARVRKSFLAAGGLLDLERVRKGIADALALGESSVKPMVPFARPSRLLQEATRSLVQGSRQTGTKGQKSIADIVAMQEHIEKETSKEKKQRRASTKGETTNRRQRFVWTPELDDLAQDAVAVVGARCRRHGKMNWQAVDQVFPGINSDGVRQRILRLRSDPATETYIMNLEQAWYTLWKANRGTPDLPDPHPENAKDFDLITHIEYMRRRIDKEQLRAGGASHSRRVATSELPATVELLDCRFDVVSEKREPRWDFLWNVLGDDVRERTLLGESITEGIHPAPGFRPLDEMDALTEAAIKMTLETEEAVYDQDVGKSLLDALGEARVTRAYTNMQERNMLTRVVSDPEKSAPGRQWRFQEWQGEVLNGPINPKVYHGAQTMEDSWATEVEQEPQELPYVIDDGNMAASIQLISDHKLDISINTSNPASARPELNGNSKKVVDDQLEISLIIKLRLEPSVTVPLSRLEEPFTEDDIQPIGALPHMMEVQSAHFAHGVSPIIPDTPTSCVESMDSTALLVDCGACLDESRMKVLANMSDDERSLAEDLLERVKQTGASGLMIHDGSFPGSIVKHLVFCPVPLLFWTGYSSPILVGCEYLRAWTVACPGSTTNPVPMVFPRRWIDIHGDVIERVWRNALRSAAGWVYNRPGISLNELLLRLAPILDRQEVLDLVRHLQGTGVIEARWGEDDGEDVERDLRSATEDESHIVSLNVVNGSWYRLEV